MKFKELIRKIHEKNEIGKQQTTKNYVSATPGQPPVVFDTDIKYDGVKIANELDPAGNINHQMGHALSRQDKDNDGDVIKDFKKSDAPQFKGKSDEKKREMAIAAKLSADDTQKEDVEVKEQAPVAPTLDRKYIKGTPERKAHKEKNKPINGHPTNTNKEGVNSADKKPETYVAPDGKTKTRMVPTDIEVVKEATDKTTERLKQLVRLGLMDKSKINILSRAMKSLEKGQVTNPTERQTLFELLNELVGLITGDDAMFAKVRMNVQKEDTEK